MCKHCENSKKIHINYMNEHYGVGYSPVHYRRLQIESPADARAFMTKLDDNDTNRHGVVALSFLLENRAVKFAYANLTAKHLNQLIPVVEEVNALRSALTLLQAKLAMSDDQILKGIVNDALSRPSTPLNINELKKELDLFAH
ncbi:hypothetical protein U2E72_13290 [Acinetobacter baumannii]|uniref:hypothetical protein n=1 Tax=Acinetobacter baumannii TaxID=470 RepID=UPI00338D51E6